MREYLKISLAVVVLFLAIFFVCFVRPDASTGLLSLLGGVLLFVYVAGGHWKKR